MAVFRSTKYIIYMYTVLSGVNFLDAYTSILKTSKAYFYIFCVHIYGTTNGYGENK